MLLGLLQEFVVGILQEVWQEFVKQLLLEILQDLESLTAIILEIPSRNTSKIPARIIRIIMSRGPQQERILIEFWDSSDIS